MIYGDGKPKPAGTWDYYAGAAPGGGHWSADCQTFSAGCFQWVPKKNGGTKRGRVQHRVRGPIGNPSEVFEAAREYCERKNKENEK